MSIAERRERQRAERYELILAAARELAEAEGWDAVTTRRLAGLIDYSQPVLYSHFKGKVAPDNPWNATSLEWSIPSPPPWNNFGGRHPIVYHDPYQYGVKGSKGDFVMQDSPEQVIASGD